MVESADRITCSTTADVSVPGRFVSVRLFRAKSPASGRVPTMDIRRLAESGRRYLERRRRERRLSDVARGVRERRLTYLSPVRLRTLERCIERIEAEGVNGDIIEAGIALGGSALLLAKLMGPGRTFHGYDVFSTIPAPSGRDPDESHERYATIASGTSEGIGGDMYYGYRDDLYESVDATFREYGISRYELHKGLFTETLHPTGPVALAHIDSDWYEPVKTCLERIYPVLSPGGFVVLDDYFDYGGAAQAVDEFLAAHPEMSMVLRSENVALRRVPGGDATASADAAP
jgi:O-methyltransferase